MVANAFFVKDMFALKCTYFLWFDVICADLAAHALFEFLLFLLLFSEKLLYQFFIKNFFLFLF